MKRLLVVFILCCTTVCLNAQNFAIGLDKMNVFYLGIDNPITIAVENTKFSDIVVKTDNGEIKKDELGKYVYIGKYLGTTTITLYKKINNKLKQIGVNKFRVLSIPYPTAKIGPYGNGNFAKRVVIANQLFLRTEYINLHMNISSPVDSFKVAIFNFDSCKFFKLSIIGNKITEELKKALFETKENDIIFFDEIYARLPNGFSTKLYPLVLTIQE